MKLILRIRTAQECGLRRTLAYDPCNRYDVPNGHVRYTVLQLSFGVRKIRST